MAMRVKKEEALKQSARRTVSQNKVLQQDILSCRTSAPNLFAGSHFIERAQKNADCICNLRFKWWAVQDSNL